MNSNLDLKAGMFMRRLGTRPRRWVTGPRRCSGFRSRRDQDEMSVRLETETFGTETFALETFILITELTEL